MLALVGCYSLILYVTHASPSWSNCDLCLLGQLEFDVSVSFVALMLPSHYPHQSCRFERLFGPLQDRLGPRLEGTHVILRHCTNGSSDSLPLVKILILKFHQVGFSLASQKIKIPWTVSFRKESCR
jgi:hypothetical protein